ncbi:period circadian protein homolog 2 isoform X1 [Symphalangus syndactylus]|uniref:period circadian protein homolog 2 isoform X1 n=1 Tax=Symphalangus syndactylus TaxID=9590 RepID=UPI002441B069|nr:period circadian protein homolog 2 isoform X2 [Symphalangus syndactylus]XP_055147100.1 period circadian protein homolog 2 isoform X2 [Symphalangus syndactylus]XP_055147101.1 period circadian protein homolog 2 isoform X2 [Symphalangus syndactylus]XP_055147102.1 period circadian protein homolog 2 isoform X2 [Symphalangus syndactylus]
MNGYAEFPPSPSNPTKEPMEPQPSQVPLQEDVDMSSGSSGHETNENCSTGRDSQGSDCDDSGKELGMLVEPPDAHQSPDAFSLMMAKSEHNPSTSGCSSDQSSKVDTHKELIKTLKELKVHLPADKKAKGKASTLATLKYALRSVKQVKANEEYYQLLMSSEGHPCGADVPSYTVEEMESVTSEHIVKNADMFAVAVSLVSGKILYISDQVASIFHCKRDAFSDANFVEFLAPHDVGVFHSFTSPYKLPLWSVCSGADSFTQECMEEKSFFCRVSVGKSHENGIRYHPFRMTPYLVKVQDQQGAESQLCCLLLAERVHSGYEAPRIPPEKRIFTTTHTPNCLFQDVDERAVPLLGYLPQDLIETPVLVQLHPSDRPLMLAIHKKILQSGGQPFDYSPIRFRARNGEYITLDTSWSSFINPWSRKISFIIGRHKVRVGPLNEDVFAAHPCTEEKALHPSIQELTEQIHRLLLQPVPHSGSSGYGSLGSNGSHEHLMSQTSSSDSNGHEDSRRRRAEICKNGNKTKNRSHYSHESGEQKKKSVTEMQTNPPAEMKAAPAMEKDSLGVSFPEELACKDQPTCSYQQISCLDSVIRYLESCNEAATLKRKCEFPANVPALRSSDKRKATVSPGPHAGEAEPPSRVNSRTGVGTHLTSLALPGKAESVASLTSQCSYSSTIVHVGDKKPQPELEMVEDAASGPESLDCLAGPGLACGLSQEKEPFTKLGLTKEVLAAHTQKEEQSFLQKFKEIRKLSIFQSHCHYYLQERSKGQPSERTAPGLRNTSGIDSPWKKTGKNRKLKSKRIKPRDSSESTGSGGPVSARPPLVGLNATAWSPSDTSQSSCPAVPFPTPVPAAYSLPVFPAPGTVAAPPAPPHASFTVPAVPADLQHQFAVQPPPFPAPLAPVMAFMLPSYSFPSGTPNLPQAFFPSQPQFPSHPTLTSEMASASQPEFPSRTLIPRQPCACPATRATPPSAMGRASPPLFQSRSSSPLQLNLLQLEEAPEGGTGTTETAAVGADCKPGTSRDQQPKAPLTRDEPSDTQNSDALSTSSGLLDLLLNEDLCSASGSAASESLGSGSLGCDASLRGAGSSDTSHTSKYFGSIDSSENNHKAKMNTGMEESERFIKCVLQDPIWLLMADADSSVMMTYQLPSRNLDAVLKEDREKLKLLQKLQPRFTDSQKQELREVHQWMQTGSLPAAIDVAECVYCENKEKGNICIPYEEDTPSLGLSEVSDTKEDENGSPLNHRIEEQTLLTPAPPQPSSQRGTPGGAWKR